MSNISIERLEDFIRSPLENGLTRGEQMEMARRLLAFEKASKAPVGWVMVPIEPTGDMCNVEHIGVDVCGGITEEPEYYYSICGVYAAKVYRAMIAVAPKP